VREALEQSGWLISGWIPGAGLLAEAAAQQLASVHARTRPIAFSRRGWLEDPGLRVRLRRTPGYLRDFRAALVRVRPHVVHANTLLSLPEACVARSVGLPVVLQVHELPTPSAKRTAALRVAVTVADVLVGVSESVSEMLRRVSRRTPIVTVYNGIAPRRVRPRRNGERFTVGTIGTVSRLKGTDVFLRAAAIARHARPAIHFEHAGQSDLHRDPGLDDELAGLLATEGLANAMTMLGRRPAEEVLQSWDAFVMPSRMDAFPLASLEAMSAGLPVIATEVGGLPEQIIHLESGVLVPPDDPSALAMWIVRLYDDPALGRRLGEEAARRVRGAFTIKQQAEGLHRAYLTALNRRFGPPAVRRLSAEV
jgi:glycosyltransferase involved in cell wall biosynthesis